MGGRELFLGVVTAAGVLKKIGSVGFGKARAAAAAEAHGATLRLVSLDGLGLEAVRDKHGGGGCRGWDSDRSRPMLQAS